MQLDGALMESCLELILIMEFSTTWIFLTKSSCIDISVIWNYKHSYRWITVHRRPSKVLEENTHLGYMHACSVSKLCPTLCDSMDRSPPGSSLYGILQARILVGCHFLLQGIFPHLGVEPVSQVPCIGRQVLYHQCYLWSPNKTHDNMDECQGHYAEWKKTVSKGYVPYEFIYVIFSKRQNYSNQWFPGNIYCMITTIWHSEKGNRIKVSGFQRFTSGGEMNRWNTEDS